MLIESKIRRTGGTPILMDETNYHFKPANANDGEPHVCEVTDDDHIARFLAIREGFKLAGNAVAAPVPVAAAPATDEGESLVLKNGDETVDLGAMSKKELLKFAKANDFAVDPEAGVAKLRADIYALAQ